MTVPDFSLGIWDLLSARSSIGTRRLVRWLFVWHTVPSWSAAHEVQDMLLLRARAAARPVQGMRRQQQLLASTGGSATTATARSVAAAASASTGGSAASARSVAAAASASTGARATTATVECGGSSICEHGRLCTTCMKEYSGSAIHKHRRQRGLYEHRLLYRRQRSWCRIVAAAASFPWRRQRLDGDSRGRLTRHS